MPQAENSSLVEAEVASDLVRRVRSGDPRAEAELVERYSRGVLFLLRRITQDHALADDLHQETFVTIIERLRAGGIGQPEQLGGFIRATARNLFTGDYRKKERRDTHSDSEGVERARDTRQGELHRVLQEERAQSVRQALGELRTDRDRQILFRFYLLEESKEAICTALELSELHFNRVLFRARQRFKQILESGHFSQVVSSAKEVDLTAKLEEASR